MPETGVRIPVAVLLVAVVEVGLHRGVANQMPGQAKLAWVTALYSGTSVCGSPPASGATV
jgi:hypothetical protein